MANQTLEEIVAIEREIQTRLTEERRKAAAWLDGEREAISKATEAELAEARQQCRQLLEAAAAEADTGVCEAIRQAENYASNLRSLSEERLRRLLADHLQQLLPGMQP